MADPSAERIRLARDRLVAAGSTHADRTIVQILALALHRGDLQAATFPAFFAACRELSPGPDQGDRSLWSGDAREPPDLAGVWPAILDLLAPAVPRDAEALGAAREALLGGARKRSGSFYTRPPLARALARRTLAGRGWDAPPTVCDPAMGCGSLLLAAFPLLAARHGPAAAIAALHGVDADPLAVDLARFLLWRAAGAPAADLGLADRLVCGDSLVGSWLADLESPVPADSLVAALDRRTANVAAPRPLHWELAFPQVFAAGGFAAVLANPPWDAIKPNAREFLAQHGRTDGDPRTDAALAPAWRAHLERHAALSRWFQQSGQYRHQGRADRNAYKLFCERCLRILRPGGALGLLVPAGIYSDHQTAGLRRLLLRECRWTHLYAFQNERFVFPGVDHRTKVAFVGATRDGPTTTLRTRFRVGPGDSPALAEIEADLLDDAGYLERPVHDPGDAIAELRDARGAAVFAAVHARSVPLVSGWRVRYAREFDMARDAALFPPVAQWEAQGYRPDEYGHWLAGDWRPGAADPAAIRSRDGRTAIDLAAITGVAVPLLQGAQIHQHTAAARAWRCGTGLRATWDPVDPQRAWFGPQYLLDLRHAQRSLAGTHVRVGYREVARSTDTRTLIAAVLPPFPAGHKVPNLLAGDGSLVAALALCAELNSLCTDVAARARLGASSLTAAFLAGLPVGAPADALSRTAADALSRTAELPVGADALSRTAAELPVGADAPPRTAAELPVGADAPPRTASLGELPVVDADALAPWAARLGLTHPRFAPLWQDPRLRALLPARPWRELWAVTPHARLRLRCLLDALVAHRRGLTPEAFAELVRGCDHPAAALRQAAFTRRLDPKGFWRVDRDRDPELRLPVLALVAFRELCARGPAAFLADDGWQLPATLRLADHGLGHDDRAREPRPVAARLGPACPEVQVDEPARGWDACAWHAARLARLAAWTP